MKIMTIDTAQLCRMSDKEGLIIQGCGGDLQEWVDGINEMLTEENILQNGSKFEKVYAFTKDGLTCLLFPFEDTDLCISKLAIWRLRTHEAFCGKWLSDYVVNSLGGFTTEALGNEEETEDEVPEQTM